MILALSAKLSGTHQSACTAAAEASDATEVHVVDTKSVTVGEHILVDYALRLLDEGKSLPRSPAPSRPSSIAWSWSACSTPSSTSSAVAASRRRRARWASCSPSTGYHHRQRRGGGAR